MKYGVREGKKYEWEVVQKPNFLCAWSKVLDTKIYMDEDDALSRARLEKRQTEHWRANRKKVIEV